MGLADRLLIRPGHEAEGLAVLQIHMCGMTKNAKLRGRLFERGELVEELLLGELLLREAAFVLVVGVDEVLHVGAPVGLSGAAENVVYLHDLTYDFWPFTLCFLPVSPRLLKLKRSRGADEVIQILADDIPPPAAKLCPKCPLRLLPKRHCVPQARSPLLCNLQGATAPPSFASDRNQSFRFERT